MPRLVDHAQRQRELTGALWRIAAARGLDAVSVREVAAEARVSIGTVQHYFATKDEMLRFAFEQMSERVAGRIRALDQHGPVPQLLHDSLAQLLPLDEERRAETSVWAAFAARAVVSPELAELQRHGTARMRDYLAGLLRRAQDLGQTMPSDDPEREAAVLIALVDGLTLHALIQEHGMGADAQLAMLDGYLGRLLPDPEPLA